MIAAETAKAIGINACIEKLGRDFVYAHRDSSTAAHGVFDEYVFCFVGVDNQGCYDTQDNVLVLDNCSKFPYRASCTVALSNGIPHFVESILPNS